MPAPVIDMWAPVLPVPEIVAHIAEHFPDAMLGYLRVFWKQRPSQQALRAGAPALARPLSDVVAALDAAGITRTLITGFDAKCVELGVPLSIHTSANWTSVAVNDLGHPRHLDPVARDFPELRIIMSHGGYPWVLEACLLAWKYENVYLELAAHRPKYLAEPGTGWEPLLRFGQTTIAEKVLWGSGAFLLQRPVAELVAEFRALPVKPAVMERWLGGNAEPGLARP